MIRFLAKRCHQVAPGTLGQRFLPVGILLPVSQLRLRSGVAAAVLGAAASPLNERPSWNEFTKELSLKYSPKHSKPMAFLGVVSIP